MTDRPTEGPITAPNSASRPPTERPSLTASERAEAFSTGRAPVDRAPIDRAAALRDGTVPVPRKFILWIAIGFAVLGLGGILAEKVIGNAGVGALISTPVTTLAGTGGPVGGTTSGTAPPTPAPPSQSSVGASPSQVIGLTRLTGHQAPALALQDQSGIPWTLANARGKVVVLTFFNSECDDICPVLAQEISTADHLLGTRSARVDFVVINSDPQETSLSPPPPALTQTGLAALPNVIFLTGPLTDLSVVWRRYGITVAVDNTNRIVTHNDVMDFIAPTGALEFTASPFANEDSLGIYSLQPGVIHTFAQGVAESATTLLRGAR